MTLTELKEIEVLIRWMKNKVMTTAMFDRLHATQLVIEREIKMKTYDFIKGMPLDLNEAGK